MITIQHIERRAAELRKRAEKLQSDLNAVLGALQDCGYWMEQLKGATNEPDHAPSQARGEDSHA